MTETADREAPLSAGEVRTILAICAPHALLVGGQALAFWADRLQVALPEELRSGVTADADFIGDSTVARDLGERLGWKVWLPTLDDATANTGKVTKRVARNSIKQIDFLSGVVGLTTKDVVRRAVEVKVPGVGTLRVMHPVDVLDSRIQNLSVLPGKRTPGGVAQAGLAVEMVRAYIRTEIEARGERAGLKLLERVADIASDIASVRVFLLFGIDPLSAVPLDDFRASRALHRTRWPQIVRDVEKRRQTLRRLTERKPSTTRRRGHGATRER